MKVTRRISAVVLSIMMILSMMPAMAFAEDDNAAEPVAADEIVSENAAEEVQPADQEEAAAEDAGEAVVEETEGTAAEEAILEEEVEDPEEHADDGVVYDESDVGYGELSYGAGVEEENLEGVDPESQMEEFFYSETPAESITQKAPLSIKGNRLTGNNLKYYNYYNTIISNVYARKTSNAYKTVKAETFLGKRTFTASQLGVKRIGYKKNGKWYVTADAKKKISALFDPQDWSKVIYSVTGDLANKGYWVNWYGDQDFYNWSCNYKYTATSLTFTTSSWIEFSVPVMPEFAKAASATTVYTYKADLTKLQNAEVSKANAKYIVESFDSELNTTFAGYSSEAIDLNRLWRYCSWIAVLTDYDHEAAEDENCERTNPWSLISVLDGNEDTKAVCSGYARAFKYLCDLSDFESDWIDCQIATGSCGTDDSNHMWNIVRMNDGLNYVVDPTWMDEGDEASDTWFLRGDPYGDSKSFTIEGNERIYDERVLSVFAAAERKLSERSYYQYGWEKVIKLQRPTILTPVRAKKAFTVKWKKVATPLGALYVDGYQIRYSTKKSMSGAKKVTVKGYNRTSRAIKKLLSNKYYYVQVRTYAKLGGKTYYSSWSTRKRVKTR